MPTQLAADLLTQNGFTSPIRAVSCGIDLERFSHLQEEDHAPGIGDGDAPRVLFVGRLSEENPEIREDVKRDVAAILSDLPIDGPSEEMIAAEVCRAAAVLTSVSIG